VYDELTDAPTVFLDFLVVLQIEIDDALAPYERHVGEGDDDRVAGAGRGWIGNAGVHDGVDLPLTYKSILAARFALDGGESDGALIRFGGHVAKNPGAFGNAPERGLVLAGGSGLEELDGAILDGGVMLVGERRPVDQARVTIEPGGDGKHDSGLGVAALGALEVVEIDQRGVLGRG